MTPAIDVHTHMLTRGWLELLRTHGRPRYQVRKSLDAPEGPQGVAKSAGQRIKEASRMARIG